MAGAAALLAAGQRAEGGPFYYDRDRPFPQRSELMSLDIVRAKDIPAPKVIYPKPEDMSLKTNDIHAAQPVYPHLNYLNKADLSVGCTDPEHHGGRARSYYHPMDRRPRDLSLTTADIEYAQPKKKTQKGNRHTDPVCPQYELPTCHSQEPPPPRFNGIHCHDISDIEKSSSKTLHPTRSYVKDPNDTRDIEYSTVNYKERVLGRVSATHERHLDPRDISESKRIRPRCTNPLEPVYKVPTAPHTSVHARFSEEQVQGVQVSPALSGEVGYVHGSKPRQLHRDNGEPQLSLATADVLGAGSQRYIGSVPANIYDHPSVRPAISFHDPSDIPGTQASSLRKGLEGSRRMTNPLNPCYASLDGADARPHPVPVLDAERGPAGPTHPGHHALIRSQGGGLGTTSLPDLRAAPPSRGGSVQQSMPRDRSAGALRQSPAGSVGATPSGSARVPAFLSKPGSGAGSPGRSSLRSGGGSPMYS